VSARATVDSMVAARTPGYYNPIALARAFTALGDIDRGMEWLRRAFEERTLWVMNWVRVDPELAPLRADPRYAALNHSNGPRLRGLPAHSTPPPQWIQPRL